MTMDTVFARCVALDRSHLLCERQIGWTGRWSLLGDFVICTHCLATQSISLAQQPFEHLDACIARGYGLHPWQELARLMSQIPRLPSEPVH